MGEAKKIEVIFELFDVTVRRLANGNKIRLRFETAEVLEIEKQLIDFRGQKVKATIRQENPPKKKEDQIVIEDQVMELFALKCRRLRNGDKLSFDLEDLYTKELELKAVKLRFDNCRIEMECIEQELDMEHEEDVEGDLGI